MAVDRIIGGVEIENDLLGRFGVRLEEHLAKQGLDRGRIMAHSMIFCWLGSAQFKPVERAFARQRRAVPAMSAELSDQRGHHRIVTQPVAVVEILIAQRNPEDPLADQGAYLMLDQICATMIGKAASKAIDQLDGTVRGT
jgi:hypothetical protein